MTEEQIIAFYNGCQSVNETSKHFNISMQKTRRILICCGVYRTELSDKIVELYETGMSSAEIAKYFQISRSAVYSYLPYTKGRYNTDTPTKNAIRIKKCRERKKKKEAN